MTMLSMPRPARADFETNPDGRPTMSDHLRELRHRLVICAVAVLVLGGVAFAFHHELLSFLTRPYCALPNKDRLIPGRCSLVVTGVTDAFTVTLKICLYAAIIAASPIWLWQFCKFVTPALYRHERRYASLFVLASTLLFAAGSVLAYLTMAKGLRFLLGFAQGQVSALLTVNSYLSFLTAMVLVFALSFEFPLLLVMLNSAGILSAARLRRSARGIVFGIVVFAAVATPSQDPFTMLALMVPLTALFGAAVLIATLNDRRRARSGSQPAWDDLSDDEASPLQEVDR